MPARTASARERKAPSATAASRRRNSSSVKRTAICDMHKAYHIGMHWRDAAIRVSEQPAARFTRAGRAWALLGDDAQAFGPPPSALFAADTPELPSKLLGTPPFQALELNFVDRLLDRRRSDVYGNVRRQRVGSH